MKSAALPKEDKLGLGASVVLELTSHLPKHLWPYGVYFDNFFTNLPLLSRLSEKGTGGTGSIWENRLQKCPSQNTASLKKKRPGTMSFKGHKDVLIVKWNDSSIVTVASNCRGITQTCKAEKIGTVDGKRVKIQVECPSVIQKYNKYMGGVNWFDENFDHFRVGLRGKKWWSPIFAFGIDVACQNAWHLIKKFR